MTKYDYVGAIMEYENGELDNEAVVTLFQYLIDTDLAWSLQGSYGRMAHSLITAGYCNRPGERKHYES